MGEEVKKIVFQSERVKVGLQEVIYNANTNIETNCNFIYFRNQGNTTWSLNNKLVLQTGQTYWISLNPGEWMDYQFNATCGAGTNPSLYVCWKTP